MSHLWLVKRESYLSSCFLSHQLSLACLPCEQALRGALFARQEKEGELATRSLEFEYLHWKSWCKMLIGGDDISNEVVFNSCFSMFVYIRADWWKSDSSVDREPQGNWRWNSNSRDSCKLSFLFPAPPPKHPRELACRLWLVNEWSRYFWLSPADWKVLTTSHLRSKEIINHTY